MPRWCASPGFRQTLESFYWADRHAYDEGKLTGLEFWQKIVRDAGLKLSDSAIEELNQWDARMWTTRKSAMLAWQLRSSSAECLRPSFRTWATRCIEHMEREFDWLSRFDVLVWSYQLRMAKPDPAIYRYVLENSALARRKRCSSTTGR